MKTLGIMKVALGAGLLILMAGIETLATVTVGAAPPIATPHIVATRPYFPPYSATGFVVLTWDAGSDHPYAEVWYKVNNGDQTFLVEQGKGSRQMTVERFNTVILTDAGTILSTVNFVAG